MAIFATIFSHFLEIIGTNFRQFLEIIGTNFSHFYSKLHFPSKMTLFTCNFRQI